MKYIDGSRFKTYLDFVRRRKILAVSVLGLVVVFSIFLFLNRPVSQDKTTRIFTVREGSSAKQIATELKTKEIIRSEIIFELFAKIERLDSKLKVGSYALSPSMTMQHIVSLLASGKMSGAGVTIPEGYTVEQIASLLADKKIIDNREQFLLAAKDYAPYSYIEKRPSVKYACEGFLFPNTYDLTPHTAVLDVLKRLATEFDQQFNDKMRTQAVRANMSIYDVVIMASLVEREAKLPEERPEVASVFLNRLKIKMPLQSCATVQYVLPVHKEVLSISDTEIDSPYNTYERIGLPAGPIANPGLASIRAVLEPAKTDYLFFVVNGKGGHYFAKTYEEHEKNISKGEK